MFDILKTIGEILIAIWVLRYLIHIYNTLGRTREPVRKALADISTYKAQREATLYHLYVIAEQFSQRESNTLTQASLANMSRQNANFQALAAAYPDLKSNQTYQSLMDSVEALEIRIQESRQEYNQAVSNYQTLRSQIPYCLLAPLFGFKPAEYNQKEKGSRNRSRRNQDGSGNTAADHRKSGQRGYAGTGLSLSQMPV